MGQALQYLLHVDRFLPGLLHTFGPWLYVILFIVVFAETGFVVTPFLPGDSLLFAAGAIAATAAGSLNVVVLLLVFAAAAILGDSTNYVVGRYLGPKLLRKENSRILRREYLDRTHAFFERYGGKSLVMARYVAIVRTFAPFMAGVGKMHYPRFLAFSVAGGLSWVLFFVLAGYLFGGIQIVKDNLEIVVLIVMFAPLLIVGVEYWRGRRQEQIKGAAAVEPPAAD